MSARIATASAPRRPRTAPRDLAHAALRVLACAALLALAACSTLGIYTPPYPGRGSGAPPVAPGAPGAPEAPPQSARDLPPLEPAPSAPSRPRSDTSSATQELLEQSRAARAAGRYPLATSTTERALRIDPNNASLWLELGEIALATGDTKQAETLARKALSLSADDRAVTAQAERLLRAAGTR